MRRPLADERGAALLVVLWLVAAMTVLAAQLSGTRGEIALEAAMADAKVRTDAAIDSALEIAVEQLSDGSVEVDGTLEVTIGEVKVDVRMSPESARIDLNGAGEDLIGGLALAVLPERDAAAGLADAILDWRDGNDLRRSRGAEAADYRRAGLDYGPADGPFTHPGELRLVLGLDRQAFLAFDDMVTIVTGREDVDTASASNAVTRASDLARGLGLRESADPDSGDGGDSPPFTTDEAGLYRVDLQAAEPGGLARRARVVLWVRPTGSGRDFEILDFQGWHLPRVDGSGKK